MTQREASDLFRDPLDLHTLRHIALTRLVAFVEYLTELSLRDRAILLGRLLGMMPGELGRQLELPESEVISILTRIATELIKDTT